MRKRRTKRIADLFKPVSKGDRLTAVYLYADGHATAAFERRLRDLSQAVRYHKQIDRLGLACHFRGRVIFHEGGIPILRAMLAAGATGVAVETPSLGGGTPITRERGIAVGYLSISSPFGYAYLYHLPELMSGDYVYQPETHATFDPDLASLSYDSPVYETLLTDDVPPCLGSMGCLCAGHARGNSAAVACDTSETS